MKKSLEQSQQSLNTSIVVYPTLKHRNEIFRDENVARTRLENSPLQKRLQSYADPISR
jgi:hypothetical protein